MAGVLECLAILEVIADERFHRTLLRPLPVLERLRPAYRRGDVRNRPALRSLVHSAEQGIHPCAEELRIPHAFAIGDSLKVGGDLADEARCGELLHDVRMLLGPELLEAILLGSHS